MGKHLDTPWSRGIYNVGPNVERTAAQATRVIVGRVPAEVRKELMYAVKVGVLGRLKKDGLKPEIFFHPDHLHGAVERQKREAEYAVGCISKGIAVKPVEQRVAEAIASLRDRQPNVASS